MCVDCPSTPCSLREPCLVTLPWAMISMDSKEPSCSLVPLLSWKPTAPCTIHTCDRKWYCPLSGLGSGFALECVALWSLDDPSFSCFLVVALERGVGHHPTAYEARVSDTKYRQWLVGVGWDPTNTWNRARIVLSG